MNRKLVQLPGSFFVRDALKWWVLSGLSVFAVAVFEYAGLTQWLRNLGNTITQPLRQATVRLGQSLFYPVEIGRVSMKKYTYVLDLELRYAEAAAQLGEVQRLRSENEQLKQQLAQQATGSGQMMHHRFAPIISYTQPTIGSGAENGVKEGDIVYVSDVAVGRVNSVEDQEARVSLFSERSLSEVIIAQTESGVSGILKGNGTEVVLEELPIEATLHQGERVVTTGQAGIRPGVYLGRVQEIHRQEGAPTQAVVLDQGVSFYRSVAVEVGQ